MKLSISKLLIACSFTFLACDTNVGAPTQPSVESPAVSALVALGPDRHITLTTREEAQALIDRALESADATDALRRQRTLGFHFDRRATTAFWTEGKGDKLGTVIQRGIRDGEQVIIATVLRPDLTVVSTLEVEGEAETFTVYEIAEGCTAEEIPTESVEVTVTEESEEGDDVVVVDAPLIGYATGGTSTQCTLQNGIINAGGQIADGLCTGEANFVCFWTYAGNKSAFNRCVSERQAACAIGTDKWNKPVCN